MSLGRSGPGVGNGFLETPRIRFGGVFLASARTASQFAVPPFPGLRRLASDAGQRLWMSITGSSSIRRLKDCPVVMDLDELSPVDRRATGGRDGRWFERFAKMCEDFPDRPRLRDERDQPDVAAAGGARKWKLLPHPRHEFRPRNPGGVVGGRFGA